MNVRHDTHHMNVVILPIIYIMKCLYSIAGELVNSSERSVDSIPQAQNEQIIFLFGL